MESRSDKLFSYTMATRSAAMDCLEESEVVCNESAAIADAGADISVPIRERFANVLAFKPFLRSDKDGNISFSFSTSDKLSTQRRENIVKAYKGEIYDCPTTVENELDMLKAVDDVKANGCNALVVFLGNFGPETPETEIAQKFDGPVMFVAAAEGDGDMVNGRGDAFCGMLNCQPYLAHAPTRTSEAM